MATDGPADITLTAKDWETRLSSLGTARRDGITLAVARAYLRTLADGPPEMLARFGQTLLDLVAGIESEPVKLHPASPTASLDIGHMSPLRADKPLVQAALKASSHAP